MTPAGILLRAQGFLRDGSTSWLADLRVEDLPAFRRACAEIRAEQNRQLERAIDKLASEYLNAEAKRVFLEDQAGEPQVLP